MAIVHLRRIWCVFSYISKFILIGICDMHAAQYEKPLNDNINWLNCTDTEHVYDYNIRLNWIGYCIGCSMFLSGFRTMIGKPYNFLQPKPACLLEHFFIYSDIESVLLIYFFFSMQQWPLVVRLLTPHKNVHNNISVSLISANMSQIILFHAKY